LPTFRGQSLALQQEKLESGPDGVLPAGAFITGMDGTSSRSPPPGREADEWATALERAGGERLRTYLRRMVGSAEVTEDILQDACERFLRHVGGGGQASGAWVRGVTHNLAVSYLRRKDRRAEVELPEEVVPELVTVSTLVESEVEYQQSMERFSDALEALSVEQKRLIDLHYGRGMKVREIAQLWGKSVAAIELRLTRARNRLRAALLQVTT
jgi:RNA polymerase sigma-70 factor, ECF subfamily